MQDYDAFPEALEKARRSLHPFIKKRKEAAQIRKVLSAHLCVHLNVDGGLRPLSLVDPTSSIDAMPHGVRGIQKEYLRCVRANTKARKEYSKANKDCHVFQESQRVSGGLRECSVSQDGTEGSLRSFLDLVQQRQKHERLRIVQDYIEMLSEKPAASAGHLDPQEVLKDVESLPRVPVEVININTSSSSHMRNKNHLSVLVDQLEKSVLRAKILLKKEQNLLANFQAENANISLRGGSRLQAVDTTRCELINWIEGELGRAGDSPREADDGQGTTKAAKQGKEYIQTELASIQRQYARYTKARQALVASSGPATELSPIAELNQDLGLPATQEEPRSASGINHTIYPYLEAMVAVSNEQKAMIQQKSYLTISLSKQLKEGSQGLNRLADESHVLPAHPVPAIISQRKASEAVSFGEQMSSHEKPDTSLRARAWVFASDSASYATKEAVSDRLVEGAKSTTEAHETMSDLEVLLGGDGKAEIWGTLDGNLGVIAREL